MPAGSAGTVFQKQPRRRRSSGGGGNIIGNNNNFANASSLSPKFTASSSKRQDAKALGEYVHRLCACDTHGGRIMPKGKYVCVAMDVPCWTEDMTHCVKMRFPSTTIAVQECSHSLTGFRVVLSIQPSPKSSVCQLLSFVFMGLIIGSILCNVMISLRGWKHMD